MQLMTANYRQETFVTLEQAPLSVNVIPWLDGATQHAQYKPFQVATTASGEPVVPLLRATAKRDANYCLIHAGETWRVSKARAHMAHPYDLAFAITAYRSQGRTIDKVIIALQETSGFYNNFGFHEFFVAISRVEKTDNIRILYGTMMFRYGCRNYGTSKRETSTNSTTISRRLRATGLWNAALSEIPEHAWNKKSSNGRLKN